MATDRPKIAIFSTGGTIASVRGDQAAASPKLTAEQLVSSVPQLAELANIETVRFRQVASSDLTVADVVALAEAMSALDRAAKSGAIHRNAAARRKSRLTLKINALLGGEQVQTSLKATKTTGKAAAAKAAKARVAASKAVKAKGAQTAAGKERAAL